MHEQPKPKPWLFFGVSQTWAQPTSHWQPGALPLLPGDMDIRKWLPFLLVTADLGVLAAPTCSVVAGALRTEHSSTPAIGIDTATPRLSWKVCLNTAQKQNHLKQNYRKARINDK